MKGRRPFGQHISRCLLQLEGRKIKGIRHSAYKNTSAPEVVEFLTLESL